MQRIPKIWGREIILHNGSYCCKLLQYDGVRTSSKHYHEKKHETFVILKGWFDIEWQQLVGDQTVDDLPPPTAQRLGPGACLVLVPRTVHRVTCLSDSGGTIVEASSHDDPEDCVRLKPSVNPFG
jgi:hypothetical protein